MGLFIKSRKFAKMILLMVLYFILLYIASEISDSIMPKKRADIYEEFNSIIIPPSGLQKKPTYKVECIYCDEQMCTNISTMLRHYIKCNGTKQRPNKHTQTYDIKGSRILDIDNDDNDDNDDNYDNYDNDDNADNDDDDAVENLVLDSIAVHNDGAKDIVKRIKLLKQRDIRNYVVPRLTAHKQELADLYLSLWCICSKIPFAAFESKWLKAHYKVIRESYKIPDRKRMSGTLIPERKAEIEKLVKSDVTAAESAMLASDGTKDRQEPITHILVCIPEPRLIAIIRNKELTESSEQTYDDLVDYGISYCVECGTEVVGYMGDNCNHQKKVGKIWRRKQKTGAPGCCTHGLCLVKGDIFVLEHIKTTMSRSQRLQNRFCNGKLGNFVVKYIIDEKIENKVKEKFGNDYNQYDEKVMSFKAEAAKKYNKRHGFQKANKTREWTGKMSILRWQLKNKDHILRLVSGDEIGKTKKYLKSQNADLEDLNEIISDDEFWENVEEIVNKYSYLSNSLDKLQGDDQMLSDVYYQWNKMQDFYDEKGDNVAWNALSDRWGLIEDDMHFGAFFGDPRMTEEEYEQEEEDRAIKYYKGIFGDSYWEDIGQEIYQNFRARMPPFTNTMKLNPSHSSSAAFAWWGRFRKQKKIKLFAVKMGQLMKACGSNSATERSNNPYKTIQTAMRGSIGPNTLDDMVYSVVNIQFIGDRIYEIYDVDKDILKKRNYKKKKNKQSDNKEDEEDAADAVVPYIEDAIDEKIDL